MQGKRIGRQTVVVPDPVAVVSWASVVGRMEGSGPLGGSFDLVSDDSFFGQKTWEQAEARMQSEALELALQKGGLTAQDVDCVFAGDLLNQNIGATFGLRDYGIPLYGVYGACSTMGESLSLLYRRAAVPYAPALRQPAFAHGAVDGHGGGLLHLGQSLVRPLCHPRRAG